MNHYVYLIEKKCALPNQEKYYIGVRSCECKIGEDSYMGSSKYLMKEVQTMGVDQFNKIILKRFDNREDALNYEIKMHKEFNVASNFIFFNKANQKTTGFSCGPGELNPFYGKKHTEEYKQRLSALLKTKDCRQKTTNKGKKFPEAGSKISAAKKEWFKNNIHPRKLIKPSEEQKKIWGLNFKNHLRVGCMHCDKIGSVANMVRWHNDNCKKRVV